MQSRAHRRNLTIPFLVTLGCIAVATSAGAVEIIGVDIGSSGSPPTNWSQIGADGTITNAIDETGAATAVDITFDIAGPTLVPQSINAGTLPNHVPSLAGLDDFDAIAASITFSDLTPNGSYDFWIFSVYDLLFGPTSFEATVTGGGAAIPVAFAMNVIGDLLINGTTGSSANGLDTYLLNTTASNTGTIQIDFANTGGAGENPLAGVAIRAVPEPTAILVLASGLMALGVRRRLH